MPCHDCGQLVIGFGLRCSTGHHSPIHLECLNTTDGCLASTYQTAKGTSKLSLMRFSVIQPSRRSGSTTARNVGRHLFRLINLFTLTTCCVCKRPTWGILAQAFKCDQCGLVAHRGCLEGQLGPCRREEEKSAADVTIDAATLRSTWLTQSRDLLLDETMLNGSTFEEVAVLYSIAWIQLRLLESGIAAGTIVVEGTLPDFELHFVVELYGRAFCSPVRFLRTQAGSHLVVYLDRQSFASTLQSSVHYLQSLLSASCN